MSTLINRVLTAAQEGYALLVLKHVGRPNTYHFLLVDKEAFNADISQLNYVDFNVLSDRFFEYAVAMYRVTLGSGSGTGPCIPTTYQTIRSGVSSKYPGQGLGRVAYMGILCILYANGIGLTTDRGSTKEAAGRVYERMLSEDLVVFRSTQMGNDRFDYYDNTPNDPDDDCEEPDTDPGYYDLGGSIILRPAVYCTLVEDMQELFDNGIELIEELVNVGGEEHELAMMSHAISREIFNAAYAGRRDIENSYYHEKLKEYFFGSVTPGEFSSIILRQEA